MVAKKDNNSRKNAERSTVSSEVRKPPKRLGTQRQVVEVGRRGPPGHSRRPGRLQICESGILAAEDSEIKILRKY